MLAAVTSVTVRLEAIRSISLGVSCSAEPHFHDEFLLLKTSSYTTQLENTAHK